MIILDTVLLKPIATYPVGVHVLLTLPTAKMLGAWVHPIGLRINAMTVHLGVSSVIA